MSITQLLEPERVSCKVDSGSKKRSLEDISQLLATVAANITADEIFTSLINRERLGSTGLGQGVAIPHGRLDDLEKPVAAFMSLQAPIDFDAIDGSPVDLVFALLVPAEATEEHLSLLSELAQMLSNADFCKKLRSCNTSNELYNLLKSWQQRESA
jgi:PTS system nitrogen regulatory IIA component